MKDNIAMNLEKYAYEGQVCILFTCFKTRIHGRHL